jgi:transcriptional regulator with XRE-family HTH domain
MIKAAALARSARRRAGLTQRELARRARIPQPTIAAIEAGRQDPRYATLSRLLDACGYELDYVARAGDGVDRTLIRKELRRTPLERLRQIPAEAAFLRKLGTAARR